MVLPPSIDMTSLCCNTTWITSSVCSISQGQRVVKRQPDNGHVEVANGGIGCVNCTDGVGDKFYLKYTPNNDWNSTLNTNLEFTLDTFDVQIDELLYETAVS